MTIGIIGIGSLTLELAHKSAQAGYPVTVHHPRGNSLVRATIEKMDSHIKLGSLEQAASANFIILFIPKEDLEAVLKNLPDMTGKIIVHTSSLIFNPKSLLSGITQAFTYTITVSLLPSSHVIKLFKRIELQTGSSSIDNNREEIYYIADDKDSRHIAINFLNKLRFSPIDLSNHLQQHTAVKDLKTGTIPGVVLSSKNYIN